VRKKEEKEEEEEEEEEEDIFCCDGAHVHQVVPEALLQAGDAHSYGWSRCCR